MKLIIYLLIYIILKFENINGILNGSEFNKLENIIQRTETFFIDLKSKFEFYQENIETYQLIDEKVNKFLHEMIEKEKRSKRQRLEKTKLNNPDKYEKDFVSEELPLYEITNWCNKILMDIEKSHEIDTDSIINHKKLSSNLYNINSRVNDLKTLMETKLYVDNITLSNLHGKNIHALSNVFAKSVVSESDNEAIKYLINYLEDSKGNKSNLEFRNVTINSNVNFFCPIPAVNYKIIKPKGLINGVTSFENFMDDLLKINDDDNKNDCQVITGRHSINSIETINANIPSLDIGFNSTRQNINAQFIAVDELEVESGGLFLPLNYSGEYEIQGTLSVSKVEIMNLIEIKGHLNGTGIANLSPMIYHEQPIVLSNNFNRHLKNVRITEWLEAKDIVGFKEKHSYNWIKSNSLPLNTMNIPIRVKLEMNQINWNNVYALESSRNWLTTKNPGIINITGIKMIPQNVILTPEILKNISITVLKSSLCTHAAFTDDIFSTSVTTDRATIKKLNTNAIFGDSNLNNIIKNLIQFDLNINHSKWIRPGVLRGPIKLKKLSVDNNVYTHEGFTMSLPREINRAAGKKNLSIRKINDIDIDNFMKSVITIHDEKIRLMNVTFTDELMINEITVMKKLPIDISNNNKLNFNLGSKTVINKIEATNINILYIPLLVSLNNDKFIDESNVNLIIQGNVTFMVEPKIRAINNWSVNNLLNNIWMKNQPTILTGKLFEFTEIIIDDDSEGAIEIRNFVNTPDENDTWNTFRNKILSRSQIQNITENVTFDSVQAKNIIGSTNARIISLPPSNLYNLEYYTLKKYKENLINLNKWQFTKVLSTNWTEISGKINDLNLNTDIVQKDVKNNVIIARKIIDNLIVNNISEYSNFDELIQNAVMTNYIDDSDEIEDYIQVISGNKIFKTMKVMNLKVMGKIAGKNIDNCLQRNKNSENFRGKKIFKGSLTARDILVTEGYPFNNMNFVYLLKNQLKKNSFGLQMVSNPINFKGKLKIIGNAIMQGKFKNVPMMSSNKWNFDKYYAILNILQKRFGKLHEFGDMIRDTFYDPVIYWNKLELVDNQQWEESKSLSISILPPKSIFLENLGNCDMKKMILVCNNDEVIIDFSITFNISQVITFKMISLNDKTLFVYINSIPSGVFIFSYEPELKQFSLKRKFGVPNILRSSVEQIHNSLWIVLDLQDHTLILCYNIWNELQKYFLPPTNTHHQLIKISHSEVNDDELLLIRDDGIWKFGGVSTPKRVIMKNLNNFTNAFIANGNLYIQLNNNKNNQSVLLRTHYIYN